MLVYRISKTRFIQDLQGTGCLYESGRWHTIGNRILYTSETVSLAKLEILVHAHRIPVDMSLAYISIPKDLPIDTLSIHDLPKDWNQTPYPIQLSKMVEEWKTSNKKIALKVPSVHSPMENNFLLNPLHPQYNEIVIQKTENIHFDGRLHIKP